MRSRDRQRDRLAPQSDDPTQDHLACHPSDLATRHPDRGDRRRNLRCDLLIGESDDGEIARHCDAIDVDADRWPVLVTVKYRIAAERREAFLVSIRDLEQQRCRDGAYPSDVFEDAAESGRFLGTFMVASWFEHVGQHQRATNTDRPVQDAIREFGVASEPKVTHFIAANFRQAGLGKRGKQ